MQNLLKENGLCEGTIRRISRVWKKEPGADKPIAYWKIFIINPIHIALFLTGIIYDIKFICSAVIAWNWLISTVQLLYVISIALQAKKSPSIEADNYVLGNISLKMFLANTTIHKVSHWYRTITRIILLGIIGIFGERPTQAIILFFLLIIIHSFKSSCKFYVEEYVRKVNEIELITGCTQHDDS